MRLGLLRKTLRDVRGTTIGMGVAAFIWALLDLLVYPEYREMLKDFEMPEAFKAFIGETGSMVTPEGFIAAEFFSWIPVLIITLAIIGGTGALAGEEGAGTLDLLLAQPVRRRRLVLEKAAGLSTAIILATMASYPAFLVGQMAVDFELGRLRLLEAVVNMIPITLLYMTLALWAGATLPSRGAAAAFATGAVVAAYFVNTLGAAVKTLEDVRKLSPFYWADASHVLVNGFDWTRTAGMLALAGAFLALALWSFERRDIAAGGREWSFRSLARRLTPWRQPPVEADLTS